MSKPNTSQEVISRNQMKRARQSSVSEDDDDELALDNSKNESVTDAIVNFLVSINASIDSYKNPHFMTLLSTVAEHGIPSCLLREDSLPIQRSLWNLEHIVNQHIIEVKDSWKTTGCTMMLYKLNEGEGKFSSFQKDNLVFGFYSVKGFFFVEGRTLPHSDTLHGAFKNHILNLPLEDVTQAIYHSCRKDQPCELSSLTPYYKWFFDLKEVSSVPDMPCVQHAINQSFMKFKETSSGWVQKLIKRSEILHKYIMDNHLYLEWEKHKARMIVDSVHECWFERFTTIMCVEYELKTWLVRRPEDENCSLKKESGIVTIIDSNEFWSDGRKLEEALCPLFGVHKTLDSLVPTAGYLQEAINVAIDDGQFEENDIDTQCFDDLLNGQHSSHIQDAATYLTPGYILYHEEAKNTDLIGRVKHGLERIVTEEEKEAMNVELEAYNINSSNPFADLSDDERLENHPVALWYKYGDEFPVLSKCATKVLSQPVTCMCKEVKKHLSKIEGKDNLVLRLNYRIMEEFKQLGDAIYNHLQY